MKWKQVERLSQSECLESMKQWKYWWLLMISDHYSIKFEFHFISFLYSYTLDKIHDNFYWFWNLVLDYKMIICISPEMIAICVYKALYTFDSYFFCSSYCLFVLRATWTPLQEFQFTLIIVDTYLTWSFFLFYLIIIQPPLFLILATILQHLLIIGAAVFFFSSSST